VQAGREYYLVLLHQFLASQEDGTDTDLQNDGDDEDRELVFTSSEVVGYGEGLYEERVSIEKGKIWLKKILDDLVASQTIEVVDDEFAGSHYVSLANSLGSVEKLLEVESSRYAAFIRMGDAGSSWLGRALVGIEAADDNKQPVFDQNEDRWEPIKFDVASPNTATAIEGLEKAIRELAADNGFSSTYPVERDSMVAAATATLQTVKSGSSTKASIKQNFIAAGRWLLEKFGASGIGAIGAELVKWGLRLLGLPI
jgi:hypothetical protein